LFEATSIFSEAARQSQNLPESRQKQVEGSFRSPFIFNSLSSAAGQLVHLRDSSTKKIELRQSVFSCPRVWKLRPRPLDFPSVMHFWQLWEFISTKAEILFSVTSH